ncbi:hypothetical protein [Winogradskya humida]|nr:hypothetical protein [Actinoplanes humidus]
MADAMGSLVGGVLVDALGARTVFVIAAAVMVSCMAGSWRCLDGGHER